jgi:hypothetical protein
VIDVEEYGALAARIDGPARVAVIGLVSRGKSTLVNQLIGIDLMPVSHKGETPADVHISSGEPDLLLRFKSGETVQGFESLAETSRSLLRSHKDWVVAARLSHPCRLPDGVTLVDTPGIDDAMSEPEQVRYLDEHWKSSGAVGAVLVISYPPGLARSDRLLLEAAQSLFGRSLVVVVKATDSSVTDEDLIEVAAQVTEHTRVTPVILSEGRGPAIEWGQGGMATLEHAIDRLAARAEQSREDAHARLGDLHATLVTAINGLRPRDVDRLEAASRFASQLPGELEVTVRNRLAVITAEIEAARERERIEAEERRVQVLDAQAAEFAKVLRGVRPNPKPNRVHSGVLKELLPLAGNGSVSAREVLAAWCRVLPERTRSGLGLNFERLVRIGGPSCALSVLGSSTLSASEVVSLLSYRPLVELGAAGRSLIGRSLRALDADSMLRVARASIGASAAVEHMCAERLVAAVAAETQQTLSVVEDEDDPPPVCDMKVVYESFGAYLDRLRSAAPTEALRTQIGGVRAWFDARLFAAALRSGRQQIHQLYEIRHAKAGESIRSAAERLRQDFQWLAEVSPSVETQLLVARLRPTGDVLRMNDEVTRSIERARDHMRSVTVAVTCLYILSYVLWAFSVLLLWESASAAVLAWLAAFLLWIGTRHLRENPRDWLAAYCPPSLDRTRTRGPQINWSGSGAEWLTILCVMVVMLLVVSLTVVF